MNGKKCVRLDSLTAMSVSEGMRLLKAWGADEARSHMIKAHVKPEIAERMLLMGYDRRVSEVVLGKC